MIFSENRVPRIGSKPEGKLFGIMLLLFARPERNRGASRKNHIGPPPGLIVDQFPAVAAAGGILSQQYVAWL